MKKLLLVFILIGCTTIPQRPPKVQELKKYRYLLKTQYASIPSYTDTIRYEGNFVFFVGEDGINYAVPYVNVKYIKEINLKSK